MPTTWVEGTFKQDLVEKIKNHWRRGYVQVLTVDSGVMKIVDMPVARIKNFPEHIQMDKDVKAALKSGATTEAAASVGKLIAERAKAAGVEQVAFDRSGLQYHGRIQALAEAAREGGLKF